MGVYRFRTPLFQKLSLVSIFGIYLCPLNLQPSNLLCLAWHSLLVTTNVCTFVSLDPFQFSSLLDLYGDQVSPLLRLYSVNCYRYLHPFLIFFDEAYITWASLPVLKLLDEPTFCAFYQKRKDKLRGIYLLFAATQLTILSYFVVRLNAPSQKITLQRTFLEQAAVFRSLYMLFYKEFCMCFLIHYLQCPMAVMLGERVQKLRMMKEKSLEFSKEELEEEIEAVLAEIQYFSYAIRELNSISSFPFLVHISTLVVNIILGGCFVVLCGDGWSLLLNSAVIFGYLAFLMTQSYDIQERVEELTVLFANKRSKDKFQSLKQQKSQNQAKAVCPLTPYLHKNDQIIPSKNLLKLKNKTSSRFRYPPSDALAAYKSDLTIRIFQMATVRCAFIAQLVFFMLNYIVIITQTNT